MVHPRAAAQRGEVRGGQAPLPEADDHRRTRQRTAQSVTPSPASTPDSGLPRPSHAPVEAPRPRIRNASPRRSPPLSSPTDLVAPGGSQPGPVVRPSPSGSNTSGPSSTPFGFPHTTSQAPDREAQAGRPPEIDGRARLPPGLHYTAAHHRHLSKSISRSRTPNLTTPAASSLDMEPLHTSAAAAGPSSADRTSPPPASSAHSTGSTSAGPASPTAAGSFFQPLLQQLSEVKLPLALKDKSSFELDNKDDRARADLVGMADRSNFGGPTYQAYSDGDTTNSQSGPSRSSTPFRGEWTGDGTDYESAYEGDAVITMNDVRGGSHRTGFGGPLTHAARRGGKVSSSRRMPAAGGPGDLGHTFGGASSGSLLSRWLASIGFKGLPKSRGDGYQSLTTSDTLKSPKGDLADMHSRPLYASRPDQHWQLGVAPPKFHPGLLKSPGQLLLYLGSLIQACVAAYHPVTIISALVFVAGFVTMTTLLIIYILNPDKEPKPWRTFCGESKPFPHDLADSLAPVDVFVGVMTMDAKYERRAIIRQTYAAHTLPVDATTGHAMSNVQLKFVMGSPRPEFARRVALEMEMYNDIVVLDVKENMNGGKTHAFFQWAASNAVFPVLRPRAVQGQSDNATSRGVVRGGDGILHDVAWKKADYVVKADDDAFLVLHELERHLRVAPRNLAYWGYLIRDWFMAGEAYALSADLVSYVATSASVAAHVKGKEDKVTSRWMRMHPLADKITYVSEKCWIYDHPKTGTAYAHGFLFPDEVEKVRREHKDGLTPQEMKRRGGPHASLWYSTVSKWRTPWTAPRGGMSVEEELESLVEGGGLYARTGHANGQPKSAVKWDDLVYGAADSRLIGKSDQKDGHLPAARLRKDWVLDPLTSLPLYGSANSSITRDDSQLPRRAVGEGEDDTDDQADSHSSPLSLSHFPLMGALQHLAVAGHHDDHESAFRSSLTSSRPGVAVARDDRDAVDGKQAGRQTRRELSHPVDIPLPYSADMIASSSHGDEQYRLSDLRKRRHLQSQSTTPPGQQKAHAQEGVLGQSAPAAQLRGGTVVVHFLKRNEWFFETALALIGRDILRRGPAPSSQSSVHTWSMYGSPRVSDFGDHHRQR
ncbi:unnamed protein product [Parajaminaea phylloscopi]